MSDELLNEFIFDSREHLSTAGAQLLDLEKEPGSLAALNALMGTMHTIKGNSGFLDLSHLYELMHHAESLLQTVRERQCACPQRTIDLLLQVLDTVEAIVNRLENGDNDQVDWLESLTEALAEAEAGLETPAEAAPPPEMPRPSCSAAPPAPSPSPGRPKAAPQFVCKDNLAGKINLVPFRDGQLAEDEESFPAKVAAMFQAGLRGLVVDLRGVANFSSRDLKTLMAAGRQRPDRTAVLLDPGAQESLQRVFRILRLDDFLHFFPDRESALDFIKSA